jgi:hypothetical protein
MPMAGGRRQQRDQGRDHLLKGIPLRPAGWGRMARRQVLAAPGKTRPVPSRRLSPVTGVTRGQGQAAGQNRLTCPGVHKPVAGPSTAANSIGPAGKFRGY